MTVDSPSSPNLRRWLFAAAMAALSLVTLAALSVPTIFYRMYSSPSSSMTPTLLLGDYFWAARTAYGWRLPALLSGLPLGEGNDPQRGDVAVFALPRDPQTVYVKRVVGLPGETIELKGGQFIINGAPIPKTPAGEFSAPGPSGTVETTPCYTETLPNGVSYGVLDTEANGPLDNAGPFVVPPGHYFVLGDNRDNSVDSRMAGSMGVGFVPRGNFLARAERIAFSPSSSHAHRALALEAVAAVGCTQKAPS